MHFKPSNICIVGMFTVVITACGRSETPPQADQQAEAPSQAAAVQQAEVVMETTTIAIPASVKMEHEEIHAALIEATQAPGDVGIAAQELAQVLHPHFVREEEIALPPLGLLAPLASNTVVSEPVLAQALAMTDALRAELPTMLEEHARIRAAVEKLHAAARAAQAAPQERLAEQLALHAQTEEEVLYPAAILVGDILRARMPHP